MQFTQKTSAGFCAKFYLKSVDVLKNICYNLYIKTKEGYEMLKNKVYTVEEYMEQGFTKIEAYVMRKVDKMFNNWDYLTNKEKERYFLMVKRLGL